ncbi:hypothetical protein MUP00_10445 [Candidatus Bathyarchaeota archaeon]|nr:hypothetical protein [Candidatus Bathyarchaeota archaeon]
MLETLQDLESGKTPSVERIITSRTLLEDPFFYGYLSRLCIPSGHHPQPSDLLSEKQK